MIGPTEERLLCAGAALEDLEPAEEAAWATHRAACPGCRELEADLEMVLGDLALAVPERIPPPGLLDAVMRAIDPGGAGAIDGTGPIGTTGGARDGRAAAVSLDEARARRAARRGRGPQLAVLGLAAALVVAVVGLGARGAALQRDVDRASSLVAGLQERLAGQDGAMATALDPGHVTAALHAEALAPSASAMVMYLPGTSRAYLLAERLPATPSGHAYQLWYADAGGVHPLQTASFDGNGSFVAPLDVDLSHAAAVMVTLEDVGGATGDPGPQVVFGEL